ncbi:MAG: hypothetical protein ACRDVD_08880 [Acidimicrobiia bacterium]
MGDVIMAAMEVTSEERQHLEEALAELESLDPADLPGPAARLADLLGRLLDPPEEPL